MDYQQMAADYKAERDEFEADSVRLNALNKELSMALSDLVHLIVSYPKAFNAEEVNMREHLRNARIVIAKAKS